MPAIVSNNGKHLLVLTLNSGRSLHLAPGGRSEVAEIEIEDNAKISTLVRRGMLVLERPARPEHR